MTMMSDPKPRASTDKLRAVMIERDAALEKLRTATDRAARISDAPPEADTTKPYAVEPARRVAGARRGP